jgi:magnesium-transporting ATPase (P-type)
VAAERLSTDGPNLLPEVKPTPWWWRVLSQLRSPIIYILSFALAFDVTVWVIEGLHEWPIETMAILVITGDHPLNAGAIASKVGTPADTVETGDQLDRMDEEELASSARGVDVFVRVSPEHELALVEALKAEGEIVAMTGDGVNDAPALKRADIDIAMGERRSEVTREVADLVLLDANFATITAAIEEGRSIYTNILKFIRFLFSTNVALVLLIAVGVMGATAFGLHEDARNFVVPIDADVLVLFADALGVTVVGEEIWSHRVIRHKAIS